MINKLKDLIAKYSELEEILNKPESLNDIKRFAQLSKEYRSLGISVEKATTYIKLHNQILEDEEILNGEDYELKELVKDEINDQNVVKVEVETDLKEDSFLKAKDFFRTKKDLKNKKIYHHVGIYCFQPSCLKKYVEFGESKQEKIQKLEQLRVLGKIDINVGYCDSNPLSVDTLEDLLIVEKAMR